MRVEVEWDLDKMHYTTREIEKWLKENKVSSGEGIMQSDKCLLSLPELMADIVDNIIEPKMIHEEDEGS